jgi:hypothetical protein
VNPSRPFATVYTLFKKQELEAVSGPAMKAHLYDFSQGFKRKA